MAKTDGIAVAVDLTVSSQEEMAREIKELRAKLTALEKRLAPAIREKVPTGKLTVLLARVGRERVAFLHQGIEEIVPMARLTGVPESAVWIAGILNFRERMVAVIDVHARMHNKARRPELSDLILIYRVQQRVVGLIVQELMEIRTVSSAEIHDAPTDVPFAPHLMGALQSDGWPVLLISVRTLVATSDVPSNGL